MSVIRSVFLIPLGYLVHPEPKQNIKGYTTQVKDRFVTSQNVPRPNIAKVDPEVLKKSYVSNIEPKNVKPTNWNKFLDNVNKRISPAEMVKPGAGSQQTQTIVKSQTQSKPPVLKDPLTQQKQVSKLQGFSLQL